MTENRWAKMEGGAVYDERGYQHFFLAVTVGDVEYLRGFTLPAGMNPELFSTAMEMATSLIDSEIKEATDG